MLMLHCGPLILYRYHVVTVCVLWAPTLGTVKLDTAFNIVSRWVSLPPNSIQLICQASAHCFEYGDNYTRQWMKKWFDSEEERDTFEVRPRDNASEHSRHYQICQTSGWLGLLWFKWTDRGFRVAACEIEAVFTPRLKPSEGDKYVNPTWAHKSNMPPLVLCLGQSCVSGF